MIKRLLVLNQDVENKLADRRYKYDPWCAPVFKAGSKWVVYDQTIMDLTVEVLRQRKGSSKSWGQAVDYGLDQGMFSEVEPRTWEDISETEGGFDHLAGLVINKLMRQDYIGVEEVRDALRAILNEGD